MKRLFWSLFAGLMTFAGVSCAYAEEASSDSGILSSIFLWIGAAFAAVTCVYVVMKTKGKK